MIISRETTISFKMSEEEAKDLVFALNDTSDIRPDAAVQFLVGLDEVVKNRVGVYTVNF